MYLPNPKFNIWEHSSIMRRNNEERSSGRAEVMTCALQLRSLLEPVVQRGWTILDAACGSGHYYHVLRDLGLEYYGLDFTESFIEIGRRNLTAFGLAPERLMPGCIEDIDGHYDVVVCFNALLYCPDFHMPLERLLNAADRVFVLRTLLADIGECRYVRDGELDEGFNHLKAYFNIYAVEEVTRWIEDHGFVVEMPVDERTGDEPEWVNNMTHPWRMLFARRVCGERV